MRKSYRFTPEFLSALCDVADMADQFVNLVLDHQPYAEVLRQLIHDLDLVAMHVPGDVGEIGGDLLEAHFDRVELRDGEIWVFEEAEEEESCQVKT